MITLFDSVQLANLQKHSVRTSIVRVDFLERNALVRVASLARKAYPKENTMRRVTEEPFACLD